MSVDDQEGAHPRAGGAQAHRGRSAARHGGGQRPRLLRQLGVSEQTYYRWRNQFGGLKAEDAKRLKELEKENSRLEKLLAEAELDKDMLREIAKGNSGARPASTPPWPPLRPPPAARRSWRPGRRAPA